MFFSVDNTAFSIWDYPMSYLELLGTVTNIYSVWLIGRVKILTWPVGIVGSILFAMLFHQLHLYADFFEQIYYVGACIYGWWIWARRGPKEEQVVTTYSSYREVAFWLAVTAVSTAGCTFLIARLHILLPTYFPEPASLPFVDGLTTMASCVAMILMAKGRIECWIYWTVINVISIGLYVYKGVLFVAVLFGVYLVLAVMGFKNWQRLQVSKVNHGT